MGDGNFSEPRVVDSRAAVFQVELAVADEQLVADGGLFLEMPFEIGLAAHSVHPVLITDLHRPRHRADVEIATANVEGEFCVKWVE